MNTRVSIIFYFVFLLNTACSTPNENTTARGFYHKSIAFHHGRIDFELVGIAKKVGFNTVEIQTEGGTLVPLEDLRIRANKGRFFEKFDSIGMETSLWVHELEDYEEEWGPIKLENEKLWEEIGKKYKYITEDLFPEIDNIVLTIVESKYRVTEGQMLKKLIHTIHKQTQEAGKQLIVRTFVWNPEELQGVKEAVTSLPEDIIIHTKYVPQDWHLRSINHPLIGKVQPHDQLVELDLAGEYFKKRFVGNCFTPDLEERFHFWVNNGVDGVVARVNRLSDDHDNTIRGEIMEINLWVLGYLTTGKTIKQAWEDYVNEYYNGVESDKLREILEPTGNVIAEALCVKRETFGDTRTEIPAIRTLNPEKTFSRGYFKELADKKGLSLDEWNEAYPDDEDFIFRNPFYRNWSVWRWDNDFEPDYHEIRKGNPEVIKEKAGNYHKSIESAKKSLNLLDDIKSQLPDNGYKFLKWKLEENLFLLQAMSGMELAWLKNSRVLYAEDNAEKAELKEEVNAHLKHLSNLAAEKNDSIYVTWLERDHQLQRGEYLDIQGFINNFNSYWEMNVQQ